MKKLTVLLAFALFAASTTFAQSNIVVYFAPSTDSPAIGELEAVSLAIPAEWPANAEAQNGWQPIYYRGTWEVYVDNNHIGKDLSLKPGSPYYLAPSKDAIRLSIATDKDHTDIISVDTWFCKMQLETILLGYIPSASIGSQTIVNSLPTQAVNTGATEVLPVTELRGTLATTGLVAKNRSGLSYKLNDADGNPLALLDISKLPERIQIKDHVGNELRVTGTLMQNENGTTIILAVQNLSKTN